MRGLGDWWREASEAARVILFCCSMVVERRGTRRR